MKNIIKRTAALALAALLLFVGLPAQEVMAADSAPLHTDVKVTGKNDNQSVTYALSLKKTTVTDGRIAIVYDPAVLQICADVEFNRFNDYDLNEDYADENGKGLCVAFVNDAPRSTSGTLAAIKFNVKKGIKGQETTIFTKVYGLNNEDKEVVPETTLEDTVKVGRGELSKPQLKSLQQTVLGVNVTWTKDANADGYVVYRSTSKNGKFTEVATTSTLTNYWDVLVLNNQTYFYKVKAFQGKGSNRVYSEESNVLSIKVKKFFGIFG